MPKVSQVFVAGGQPTVTYNPRSQLNLDKSVQDYLSTLYKILSVSGPTKSGKTVLVRKILPLEQAIWVSGGQIDKLQTFWEHVIQRLDAFTSVEVAQTDQRSGAGATEVAGSLMPQGMGVSGKDTTSKGWTNSDGETWRRSVSPGVVGPKALKDARIPLVVDDFHYINTKTQGEIVRAIKDAVFEGVPVVFISVPHRAFDSVRVEREMTGRVQQLSVPQWNSEDLQRIATDGFSALGLNADPAVLATLADESFASPHLMQDFCGQLCRDQGLTETVSPPKRLEPPKPWDEFFRKQAAGAAKSAFDRLAIGPRQRTDRIERRLKNGEKCDIYLAVLLAIAETGPKAQLSYEEIRSALRDILDDSIPQAHEVTRVLDQMSKIAHEEIEGEAVVDWDKEFSTLHISDPFFAYYLRWGASKASAVVHGNPP